MQYTNNLGLKLPSSTDKKDINDINGNFTAIDTKLGNGVAVSPSLSLGMNNKITPTGATPVIPSVTYKGQSQVNLFGSDGNCEVTSKWGTFQCTTTLDTTNKIFGSNGFKGVITGTTGYIATRLKSAIALLDATKYYMFSAYVKNGNATNVRLSAEGVSVSYQDLVTDTTKFTRVCIVLTPSQVSAMAGSSSFAINVTGTSGQYAYVDGIMLNEISASDYSLSEAQLLAKYPYGDSYACTINPYIQVIHDNLFRNGNGEEGIAWWTYASGTTLAVVNGKFQYTGNNGNSAYQIIKVKPNTDYYISYNFGGGDGGIQIYDEGYATLLKNGSTGTFNTGSFTSILIRIRLNSTTTVTVDSIMLVEGTSAPTQYLPFRQERMVVETMLTSDDTISISNGEVSGLVNWKHRTLFGKDYDYSYYGDLVGAKQVRCPSPSNALGTNIYTGQPHIGIKYDGGIIPYANTGNTSDAFCVFNDGYTYLSPKDTDTGWTETLAPNADEIKAFMNGWKAIKNNGSRYSVYVNILDNTVPSALLNTKIKTAGSTTTLTVTDGEGSNFPTGVYAVLVRNGAVIAASLINSVTANTIVVATAMTTQVGDSVVIEDPTTNTNYCKQNVAPGYQGYQLHYKLANPEPLTDTTARIEGDIPKFDIGDNYLFLDCGYVLNELATFALSVSDYAYNTTGVTGAGLAKYKLENFLATYKNGVYQTTTPYTSAFANGNYAESILGTNYEANANYSVDYKILSTIAPSVGVVTCSYGQDVFTAITKLEEEINSRQTKDSILDSIIDRSMYEVLSPQWLSGRAYKYNTNVYGVKYLIPMTPKKTIPIFNLTDPEIRVFNANGSNTVVPINDISIFAQPMGNSYVLVVAEYYGTNATYQSNALNYGMHFKVTITADCRGRV